MSTDSLIYNLLNLQGQPVAGSYLEVLSFPTQAPGQAFYFDQDGTEHDFTFTFNLDTCQFEATLKEDGQKFFMTPVTNEDDEIVRFKVTFGGDDGVEVMFAWENENEDIFWEPTEEFEMDSLKAVEC